MLFKNIENTVTEHIIGIYSKQQKQVFIAIDELGKFSDDTQKILDDMSVLKLEYEKTLFVVDWKKEEK
jgi:hypothetical protein